MKPATFRLRSWESWPSFRSVESVKAVPTLLRRRITLLGQYALSSAWSLPDSANARLILSSRHGEFSRTLTLLEAVTSRSELSPADFTLSVHHALIGLLSIVHGNRRGHTAVASGSESFCLGLLEAVACLKDKPEEKVVLIHFDDLLPSSFAVFNEDHEQPIALVLALSATGEGENIQIDFESAGIQEKPSASHAMDFIAFLANNSAECLSAGEHRNWRWSRHDLA